MRPAVDVRARPTAKLGHEMAFKIEITPRNDTMGGTVYAVVVTIDDHETVVSFRRP